ncbi:unnamed protein product [Symbiodinium sp. CCMP2456]|nr:unnamed protein product [Symbiodinium sp. CCMP2456]
MTSCKDMPYKERKRQYAALRRAILKKNNPALTAKFSLCSDGDRFGMLKSFLVNEGVGAIEIEERFQTFVKNLRTDKYTTVTIFQLEKIYGTSEEAAAFIEALIKGQAGTPHPQAPGVAKAKMYKVLKEIVEENQTGTSGSCNVRLGGRVNESSAKRLLAKQLGPELAVLDNTAFVDMKTGKIASKTLGSRAVYPMFSILAFLCCM